MSRCVVCGMPTTQPPVCWDLLCEMELNRRSDARDASPRRRPVRLTRRGEIVVTVLGIIGVLLMLGLVGGIEGGLIGPGSGVTP